MEFCSEYGYNYGYNGSDEEDVSDNDDNNEKCVRFKIRKADTNIVCVNFDDLILPIDSIDIELITCRHCGAVISFASEKNIESIFDKLIWICEYCADSNDVTEKLKDVKNLPKNENFIYLVDPKFKNKNDLDMLPKLEEEVKNANYLVFCIDVSGSMNTPIKCDNEKEKLNLTLSDLNDNSDNLDYLSINSNSLSSFDHFSDEDDYDDSNRSNLIDKNHIILNAHQSDVDMVNEEEQNLNIDVENIEIKLKNWDFTHTLEDIEAKNRLINELKELKIKRNMLDEQKAFFEESLRKQDENRHNDLLTQFSLYSNDDIIETLNEIKPIENKTTRLDGVKLACIECLDYLKRSLSSFPVVLVTFNDHVKYYGDCSEPVLIIDNEKDLCSKERLNEISKNLKGIIKPVSVSYNGLESIIKQLVADGGTALGPALQFSIDLASKRRGSQIILCTDGRANVGIGDIENEDLETSETFYNCLADYAKLKNVVVNCIAMEGTNCKLAVLGHVTDRTNGSMLIVNPLDLKVHFNSIIQKRIIATNVEIRFIVNYKYIYIRDEEYEKYKASVYVSKNNYKNEQDSEKFKKSVVTKHVGNVTLDTEITFEYGIKKHKDFVDDFYELPFQLQIFYETPNGNREVRVYTKKHKFTKIREEAEKCLISKELLFSNASQKITRHVLNSNIKYAKHHEKVQHKYFTSINLNLPKSYHETMNLVKNINKNKKSFLELNDNEAQILFSNSKASRAIFK